jgi:phosphoribosylaminoimidazole-succinocarboxamide synthase
MELVYDGKTKRVYRGKKHLVLEFKDTILGHPNGKPDPGGNYVIGREPQKGEVCAKTAVFFFKLLGEHGVKTHFLRQVGPTKIEVLRTRPIPLEVIYRKRAWGSFLRRYGKFVRPLAPLNVVEFCLKDDSLGDPLISPPAIQRLGLASASELKVIEEKTKRVAEILTSYFDSRKLRLIDFKVEFGRWKRDLLLIDALNTDSMRVADRRWKILNHRGLARELGVIK